MIRPFALMISAASAARERLRAPKSRLSGLPLSTPARTAFLCAAAFFAGCTDASITRARQEIASRNYASAHYYFASAAVKSQQLSPRERRAVMDGLCLTEYQIGAPIYALSRQLRTCAAALNEPGSESGQIFAEVTR